jgi:osmoprotectant transport system ATP-binding protein
MRTMIALRNVTKRFGGRVAVDDVSLTVEPGTTHVLLGSSGSGKSTIVRILLGLVAPDAGEVVVGGLRVTAASRRAVSEMTGYVVQEGALYPHLSAADNVVLPARARGWPRPRMAERLETLRAMADLDAALLRSYPHELSGGQRQRVGLMRALMLDPPILLLDEPLGALDPLVRAELQAHLRRIFDELGKTVLMVTHDIREAVVFGTTITLMTAGRIVQHGSFADLVRRPAEPFVTEFMRAQTPPPEMRREL